MNRKIVWLSIGSLIVVFLLMMSCAPAPPVEEKPTPKPPTPEKPAPIQEKRAPPVKEKEMVRDSLGRLVEKPRYGGALNLVLTTDPYGWDTAVAVTYAAYPNLLVYDDLLQGDVTKGPGGTGAVSWSGAAFFRLEYEVGCLAERWEVPDAETVIWRLRKGVRFSNKPPTSGREFVADDVVAHLRRMFAIPKSALSVYTTLRPISVTAPDKYTVVLKCQPGAAGELLELISEADHVYPRDMVEKHGNMNDWRNACGTGPFILVDYLSGSSATLIKNPDYWMKDPFHPDNTLPYLDGVKFLIIPDLSTRLAATRTGKVDILENLALEDARSLMKTNAELKHHKFLHTTHKMIGMRTDKPELPYKDIRVRRALSMAIDKQAIADKFWVEGEVLNYPILPLPEFRDIFTPLNELPKPVQEDLGYHPEKARQLLAEAGYPKGFKTEIICTKGHVDELSLVKAYWADIGVELTLRVVESAVYSSYHFRHNYEHMFYGIHSGVAPFRMYNVRAGTVSNVSCVNDQYIEETYYKIAAAYFDEPKRRQLVKEVAIHVNTQCWTIQVPLPYYYMLWQPWVNQYYGEYCIGPYNMFKHAKWIWLDQQLKEKICGRT